MSGQTLSERLANLSNSKSYVFLGRGGSGSNSNSNNNITDISKKATARASRSSYTANLSRDDFLIFELQSLPRQDKNDNNNTLINDSSDYSIVYHHWTLRQLYRHVVSSIRIRSTDPVPHSLKSSTVATPNATTTSGASTHDNDSVHTDVPRNKSSSTHNRTASTQRRQHSTPAVSRNNHRRQTSHDSHPSHHSHQYHHGSQPHAPIPPPKLLGSNLHPRDMRRLVTPFSASNEPELIVRRHVMVFNCDPLRAIITRDRLLVLVPMGADSVLKKLEERIVGNRFEYDDYDEEPEETRDLEALESKSESAEKTTTEDSGIVFESDLDSNDENDVESGFCEDNSAKKNEVYDENAIDHDDIPTVASDDWSDMIRMEMDQQKDLTFELLCVNACLSTVFEMLADDTAELQEKGLKYVQNRIIGNRNGSNGKLLRPEDSLAVIRNLKNAVQVMQARVKGFVQSIDRILNEDEDMALMNTNPNWYWSRT
ncbi:unnamed protein product [Pseudo-nitzschia multistriata]|uniref:Magnesium transporter n=1 Tax=Pseudo-nitzschia multistriata TaxID=183589 RepID=A0A448Z011_9STRA|nr:unnamed protein product [Pseudo-nitzschia multistriata]